MEHEHVNPSTGPSDDSASGDGGNTFFSMTGTMTGLDQLDQVLASTSTGTGEIIASTMGGSSDIEGMEDYLREDKDKKKESEIFSSERDKSTVQLEGKIEGIENMIHHETENKIAPIISVKYNDESVESSDEDMNQNIDPSPATIEPVIIDSPLHKNNNIFTSDDHTDPLIDEPTNSSPKVQAAMSMLKKTRNQLEQNIANTKILEQNAKKAEMYAAQVRNQVATEHEIHQQHQYAHERGLDVKVGSVVSTDWKPWKDGN